MSSRNVPESLLTFIEEESGRHKCQLVDVSRKGNSIEVVLDSDNGITVKQCAEFNRAISLWKESNDQTNDSYFVEVCSPGLDRQLRSEGDFAWAVGKQVKIMVKEPVHGKVEFVGILSEAHEMNVVIKDEDGENVILSREIISLARVCTVS